MSPVHNMLVKNFFIELHPLGWPLKKIFIYVLGCEKRKPKYLFTDWSEIRSKKLIFINLNRYPIYQAAVEYQAQKAF